MGPRALAATTMALGLAGAPKVDLRVAGQAYRVHVPLPDDAKR
jgi:hypothetical protein